VIENLATTRGFVVFVWKKQYLFPEIYKEEL